MSFSMLAGLPRRVGSQRGKDRSHNVFCILSMEVTCPHFCCICWSQTNSDSMWVGLRNGDSSQWWDHRGRECTWRLAATIFPFPQLPPLTVGHTGPLPQSPAAGDTQEVTYAQLDHRALTLRAARAVSPQATEPTADSNTYAALARR